MNDNQDTFPNTMICFSHLRWDFVYQRPQHLLSRFSRYAAVYFIEEPLYDTIPESELKFSSRTESLTVVVPHLDIKLNEAEREVMLIKLLDKFLSLLIMEDCAFWYYTPMALKFSAHYKPKLVVYDCMDELSAFKFAPVELIALEKELLSKADVVFTGGESLYEAKKNLHDNIYPFPSSIEKEHFAQSRQPIPEPADQAGIQGTKIGFFGVLDERLDIGLIAGIAEKRPDWQIILIGPVVKIDPETLPKYTNIHYLGQKSYAELPGYLSGWDMAMIPFLLNASTKFISPTKTPEYLAAGVPVISTPIRDVVRPYGVKKLVYIGSTSDEFIDAIESELNELSKEAWLTAVDDYLKDLSWDHTLQAMKIQMQALFADHIKISAAS